VVAAAQDAGLIINAPNAETIRVAPPLTIGDVEIDEFVELFAAALGTVSTTLSDPSTTEVSA
jgi:acetylornithine/N-succinyldiaminopimelate aminotransferase